LDPIKVQQQTKTEPNRFGQAFVVQSSGGFGGGGVLDIEDVNSALKYLQTIKNATVYGAAVKVSTDAVHTGTSYAVSVPTEKALVAALSTTSTTMVLVAEDHSNAQLLLAWLNNDASVDERTNNIPGSEQSGSDDIEGASNTLLTTLMGYDEEAFDETFIKDVDSGSKLVQMLARK
jgi:hypothetical protein